VGDIFTETLLDGSPVGPQKHLYDHGAGWTEYFLLYCTSGIEIAIDSHAVAPRGQWRQRVYEAIAPLTQTGTKHEVSGRAHILVPDLTFTAGVNPQVRPAGPIGEVASFSWEGMRHYDIANVRGLSYDEDRALGIWEVDAWGRLDEFALGRLWQLFESFLLGRFPGARRIYTNDAEPHEETQRNREFLKALGYQPVAGTHRIFAKEVTRK